MVIFITSPKYLVKIQPNFSNKVNIKVKDHVPLFPKSPRTTNLVTCSSSYDFYKRLNFHEIQDSLVSICYSQLWSFLWPRWNLNQPIFPTWKMNSFISSFQNVQELGIWIKGTQVMILIRQHVGMSFHMYTILMQA